MMQRCFRWLFSINKANRYESDFSSIDSVAGFGLFNIPFYTSKIGKNYFEVFVFCGCSTLYMYYFVDGLLELEWVSRR